ncbi:PaaI family thioesterase [Micromonospora sp. NPDC005113]
MTESATSYLRSIVSGGRSHPAHLDLLGVRITSVDPGRLVLTWTPGEHLLNPAGIVHGGFVAAVLDMAAGLAAASDRDHFQHHLTLEMHIDFLAPVYMETAHTVTGRAVRTGKTSSLADATVVASGCTVARYRGTFLPNRNWRPSDERPTEGS